MQSRRDFLKTGAYAAPLILTVAVRPSFAVSAYKPPKGNNGLGNGLDPQPPGDPKPNDEPTAIPGQPNARIRK